MDAQPDNEYQRQVDEVIKEAGEGAPKIPPFLQRKKKVERVKKVEKSEETC